MLTHVPIAFRESCTAIEGVAPVVATASCTQDNGEIRVMYSQYATNEDMDSAYQGFVSASEIEPDSGDCKDATTWPAENNYTINSLPAGRWLCTDKPGDPTIYWTDERLHILSQASHALDDHARLVDFWVNDSGPYE